MSSKDTAPPHRATNSASQSRALSRRRLLGTGAAAAAVAVLPTFAGESRAAPGTGVQGAHGTNLTDERKRLLAVLDRHGPELGSGR